MAEKKDEKKDEKAAAASMRTSIDIEAKKPASMRKSIDIEADARFDMEKQGRSGCGSDASINVNEGLGDDQNTKVVIAILVKQKAHCLPRFLQCIESQTWPKNRTHLYIRTNNNKDNTTELLRAWLTEIKDKYASWYFDDKDVTEKVEKYGQHEWNATRFRVLGRIRQESIAHALRLGAHYFVADCDNFCSSDTLSSLFATNLPVVGPMLTSNTSLYSNFHNEIDAEGYYRPNTLYDAIHRRNVRGLICVPVIHCTYFLRNETLTKIKYGDETTRHEYVIFSDHLRRANIEQYLDNRVDYGRITGAETVDELMAESWIEDFPLHPLWAPPSLPFSLVSSSSSSLWNPTLFVAQYGAANTWKDVTAIVMRRMIRNSHFKIPRQSDFNLLFGDPVFGVAKRLVIYYNHVKCLEVEEMRTNDFDIDLPSLVSHPPPPFPPPPVKRGELADVDEEEEEEEEEKKKKLVISPQGGLGNRLRAVAAAVLVARQLGRQAQHAWIKEDPAVISRLENAPHLFQIRASSWTDYFEPTPLLACFITDSSPPPPPTDLLSSSSSLSHNLCYTEWKEGSHWWTHQSSGQRRLGHALGLGPRNTFCLGPSANPFAAPPAVDANILLVETTHSLRLSSSCGGIADDLAHKHALTQIYKTVFRPQAEFAAALASVPDYDIGISIRRNEFLHYFPEARQSFEFLLSFLGALTRGKSWILFSDDHEFRDRLRTAIFSLHNSSSSSSPSSSPSLPVVPPMSSSSSSSIVQPFVADLPRVFNHIPWKRGFLEFLCLGTKCNSIYGTPSSSFAQEAAVFGGRPYFPISP